MWLLFVTRALVGLAIGGGIISFLNFIFHHCDSQCRNCKPSLNAAGALVVVCTFVMEMLLPQQRMALRAFFNWVNQLILFYFKFKLIFWRLQGVARLMITGICYYTRAFSQTSIFLAMGDNFSISVEWRFATFWCALLTLPAILILIFFFPESPTWLHTKVRLIHAVLVSYFYSYCHANVFQQMKERKRTRYHSGSTWWDAWFGEKGCVERWSRIRPD